MKRTIKNKDNSWIATFVSTMRRSSSNMFCLTPSGWKLPLDTTEASQGWEKTYRDLKEIYFARNVPLVEINCMSSQRLFVPAQPWCGWKQLECVCVIQWNWERQKSIRNKWEEELNRKKKIMGKRRKNRRKKMIWNKKTKKKYTQKKKN